MNRIYKNKAEIKAAVYEAYITRNDELNSDYFSIPVKASVKALLEACTEIQDTINNRKGKIDMNRIYKNKAEIKAAVYEAYITGNDELNSDHFSILVKASVKALLEAYAEIQDTINGDAVVQLENCSRSYEDNDKSEIHISGKEIPLCEDMGVIYEGNYMDFLLQYNNKESETQLYRLVDVIHDDDGSISGTKLDFIW